MAKSIILFSVVALCGFGASMAAGQSSNRAQFEGQRSGRYVYTPFSAMASPVVLPMNGEVTEADWVTGLDVSLGGVIFPHLHVDTAIGTSTGDQRNLQVGHHDPNRNGFTWQNLEAGLSGRFGEYFEAFGTYAASVDSEGHWEGIYEEWFVKLQNLELGLLGEFELRGGRIYNRFGIQNTYHPHGFDWVDQYLVNARALGEDSLTTIGADVTWRLPVPWLSQLDVAVGVAPDGHGHDHHGGEESEFEAEGAAFDDVMTVVNWTNVYNYNDFHQYRGGVSGAWGDNQFGRGTEVYGVHFEYQWRENGFEPGGSYFRWRTEAMWRRWGAVSGSLDGHGHEGEHDHHAEEHEHHEEAHGHEGGEHHAEEHHGEEDHDEGGLRRTFEDYGFYTSVLYGFTPQLEVGLRAEYVTGVAASGLDERFRVSPGLTYFINDARTVKFRVQYNYDHSSSFGDEHSVWGQVSLAWGGPEVR